VKQGFLFPDPEKEERLYPRAINVASVPQRSPFRYPGGKTWFVPTFRRWMRSMHSKPSVLVEPFAGGGIISLTALFENLAERVVMVERDEEVAAVWQAVVNGYANWLARRVLEFNLTRDNVVRELSKRYKDCKAVAFQTLLRNRTLHGGILAEGSGFLKHGEKGKGISSRWYPKTLARRFENLSSVAPRIEFICGDGFQVLHNYARRQDVVYFIDPPYTVGGKRAGQRLYKYHQVDHERLFGICERLKGDFLMTYDLAEEVKQLARAHGFEMKPIAMTNTHNAEMTELIVGRDLSWMTDAPTIREKRAAYRTRAKKRHARSDKEGIVP